MVTITVMIALVGLSVWVFFKFSQDVMHVPFLICTGIWLTFTVIYLAVDENPDFGVFENLALLIAAVLGFLAIKFYGLRKGDQELKNFWRS